MIQKRGKVLRTEVRLTADVKEKARERTQKERPREDEKFVIVVMGNFSGAVAHRPAAGSRFFSIDRDNFNEVMRRVGPRWEEPHVSLSFAELDDFHPDRIAGRAPTLRALLDTRTELSDPSRFAAAAARASQWAKVARKTEAPAETRPPERTRPVSGAAVLGRILDEAEPGGPSARREPTKTDLQRWVEEIVAPHLVRVDTRRQTELIGAVDQALGEQMRPILHDPAFQHLEAAWRCLWRLVMAVEDDIALKVRILDCSQDALRRDLAAVSDPHESKVMQSLLHEASLPGGQRPALLVGNYEFDHSDLDMGLLTSVATIARQLGASFVAAARPRLLGCQSFTELSSGRDLGRRFEGSAYRRWHEFRRSAEARSVGLALPRLLCRLPYGSDTERVETFEFEEWTEDATHAHLLWGNPAFAVATVVASAFARDGWSLDPTTEVQHLEGLPLFIYRQDGEAVTMPCAEVLLPESLLDVIEEQGLIPLVSRRDSDSVALPCLQSLSTPRTPLRLNPDFSPRRHGGFRGG